VDLWSVGMIMYMLITDKHPIYKKGDSINDYIKKLNEPQWEFPDDFSELAKDFFLKLVKIDILDRYTAAEALQHPWITRIPGHIPLSYKQQTSLNHSKEILLNV